MLDIKLTLEVHFFMSKYTYEFKLKIVKEHLNEHFGFAYLSKKYNIQSKENRFFVNCGGQKLSLSIMKCVTE